MSKAVYDKYFNLWALEIKANIKSSGQYASGNTSKTYVTETKEHSGILFGATYPETGRKAGKHPPMKDLIAWVGFRKYGINYNDENEKRQIAFAIANKIAKKGDQRHRKGGKTGVISDVINDENVDKLVSALGDEQLTIITNSILDGFDNFTTK